MATEKFDEFDIRVGNRRVPKTLCQLVRMIFFRIILGLLMILSCVLGGVIPFVLLGLSPFVPHLHLLLMGVLHKAAPTNSLDGFLSMELMFALCLLFIFAGVSAILLPIFLIQKIKDINVQRSLQIKPGIFTTYLKSAYRKVCPFIYINLVEKEGN